MADRPRAVDSTSSPGKLPGTAATPGPGEHLWRAIVLLLALWIISSLGAYLLVVRHRGELFDFYPRWYGARAMLRGEDPYSLQVTREIRQSGIPLKDWALSGVFLYPATITYLLLPFWLLPFEISVSLWNGLQLLLVMAAPLIVFVQLGWQPKPLMFAGVTIFSSLAFRHPVNVFVLGQFTIFVLAALIIAWWGIRSRHGWLAAMGLAGASIRPEGAILVGLIVLHLLLVRRFDVLGPFGAVLGVALALSVVQIGFWLPEFVAGMLEHSDLGLSRTPLSLLGSKVGVFVFTGILFVWAFWLARQMGGLGGPYWIPWNLSVAALFVLLALPQTNNYTLVYALLPMWLILRESEGKGWLPVGVFLLLSSPWLFLLGKERWGWSSTLEQLVIPLLAGGLLSYVWLRAARPRLVESARLATP
jgi:hypothetical protein